MRSKCVLTMAALFLLVAVTSHAAVSRVVVVQASDGAAYVKAIEQGKALLKSKGASGNIRVWRARFAGDQAGAIVVTIEYASLAALAADDALMASDPELRGWLQSLDKLRKVVSDSVYQELQP
jgi:hypothetical protein